MKIVFNKHRGFTLIELMIVVTIISLISGIAANRYQDYLTRARWAENYGAVIPLKASIAECTQANSGNYSAAGVGDSLPNLITAIDCGLHRIGTSS
jgi:type IV pilus assembly protein PilA